MNINKKLLFELLKKNEIIFALVFFGLAVASSVGGRTIWKGWISVLCGLLIATIGQDPVGGINRYNFESSQGAFGHKVMTIETVHGTLHLVKEPLFRGISSGFMLFADMTKVAYRPLVGNGINRDTYITTNVQSDDEDLRKDMILTEAGLEVSLPESHYLINLEGV